MSTIPATVTPAIERVKLPQVSTSSTIRRDASRLTTKALGA